MLRLLAPLLLVFKAWMFIDAVRRNAPSHWFWVIMVVPFGDVAYFFAVKMRDRGMRMMAERMLEGFKRPPSIDELEERYHTTPSLLHRTQLAQGLFDAGRFDEAKAHFEQILVREPTNKDGLYGLGMCRLELGDWAGAVEPLSSLLDLQKSYRDYAVWAPLAEALWLSDCRDECLELMVDLVKAAPRLKHRLVQARYLARADRTGEAEEILRAALREHERSPWRLRWDNRPYALRAEALLAEITQPAAAPHAGVETNS